jgi:antitoxin HicB
VRYELVLQPDHNDAWLVTPPQFEELVSFGATQEEACRNGPKAIEEAIAARIAQGEDIPHPPADTPGKGSLCPGVGYGLSEIRPLHDPARKRWTRADLMRALGCRREHVDRLFRLDHNSRLDSIEDAFCAWRPAAL